MGETGFPKHLLGTIQSILVTGNPLISIFETILPQNHVFPTPIFPPKTSLGQPEPNFQIPGPNFGSGVQKWVPGTKNQKDAGRKTMQNPASRIPNGAIWCKLWPKTILGPTWGPRGPYLGPIGNFPTWPCPPTEFSHSTGAVVTFRVILNPVLNWNPHMQPCGASLGWKSF